MALGPQAPDRSNSPRRDALLRQVDAAVARGQLAQAAEFAEQGLSLGIEHPGLLNLVAHQCIRRNDFERARTLLEQARTLAPGDIHVLNGLGIAYKRLGRLKEALAALDAALAIDPLHVNALYNRATVLEADGELDAARLAYEHAVRCDPENAEALSRLSFLAAMNGDYVGALAFGERALKQHADSDPAIKLAEFAVRRGDFGAARDLARAARKRGSANPWAGIVLAQAESALGDNAAARGHVDELLRNDSIAPPVRAFALSVAADIDDRAGDTAAAFANYVASKEGARRHYAKEFAAPGTTSYFTLVERTAAYFRDAPAATWAHAKANATRTAAHAFLLGFPRSGTTLLQQALAARPDVATAEEMNPLPDAIRDFFLTPGGWARLAALDEAALAPYRETYWRLCRAAAPALQGRIFVDKNPLRTVFLPIVARLFPEAKILFAVRDPRDVVLSCLRQQFRMSRPMYEFCTLEGGARLYDAVMRLAGIYREKLSLDLLEVRHEDLVADFETSTRRVCTFLGIEWAETMRDVAAPARTRLVKTPSASQLAGGVNASGVGNWRRYKDELAPVMPLLMPWVVRFGYPEE